MLLLSLLPLLLDFHLQGLWPNYLKVVPSIAIAFVCYEQVKELLGVEFRISE
jgi:solute carrier family 25 phosphate transporter 23/24/25/41